jgi:hypothetical protein
MFTSIYNKVHVNAYSVLGDRTAALTPAMYEVGSITNANGPISQQLRNIAQKGSTDDIHKLR